MNISINQAKLVKGENLNLSYDKKSEDGKNQTLSSVKGEDFPDLVHPDLKAAFETLAPHLAILSGYVKSSAIEDFDSFDLSLFDGFKVASYSRGGTDDAPGVVVSGHYHHAEGVTILNTPFKRFGEGEKSRYVHMDDLEEKLIRIDKEIASFLSGSKRGTDGQLTLFDQDKNKNIIEEKSKKEKVTKAQIAEPATEKELAELKFKIPPADPEAMKSVKQMKTDSIQEAIPAEKRKAGRPSKKVAQSAENPSGEIND